MKSNIDATGRIVAPKGPPDIEIMPAAVRLKKRGKGVVAVPETDLPALTTDEVRATLERTRR